MPCLALESTFSQVDLFLEWIFRGPLERQQFRPPIKEEQWLLN